MVNVAGSDRALHARNKSDPSNSASQCLPNQHHDVTRDGYHAEDQQRAALSPSVGQPAARICVQRSESSLQRVEQSDYDNPAAERFDVLGREAKPESLPRACEEKRDQKQRRIAPQRQEFRDLSPATHFLAVVPTCLLHSA